MDGVKVTILKNSINRVAEKRGHFLFPMETTLPCILHIENRLIEKLITMCLLEGLKHRAAGVNTNSYFIEIESVVDNVIMSVYNGNWKLPVNGYTLSLVSLFNKSARKFGAKIGMLFDSILCHPSDKNLRRDELYVYVVTLYQDLMTKTRKR